MEAGKALDYSLSRAQAETLAASCLLPADMRVEIIRRYASDHGREGLIDLLAQFIGMANSVVDNNREMIELLGLCEAGEAPNSVEKYNLPTIFGATQGALLAAKVPQDDGMCAGCAFRLGTCANQSPSTTCDADWCGHPGEEPFMCHEELDEKGEPTKGCAGFARLRKSRNTKGNIDA